MLRLRGLGEVSKVQFKERILDKYDIGCELVAMSNFRGGQLVIGIHDKTGEFNPLSYAEVQETTSLTTTLYGAGTGIHRALEDGLQVEFKNDERTHEFLITIERKEDLDTVQANSDTNLDTVPQRRKLSNKEKDIIQFCSVPRSTKEILDRVGVSSHTKNREKYVTSLVEAGYLGMTNPDNPNASNQKYRKK